MPAPGDQHSSIVNPFEEQRPRVSEYTAVEIATLQSRLEKQLGPEYISARAGPSGQKVHYIAAEKCIALANEVFGFNGWSSSIQNVQVDFVDEHPQTLKISLGLSVIVRVTLRDGSFHEDIGYGHIENCKGKAAAFEKAKKEGTTDALKRALRNFGNVLGNCIYDKAYLAKVTKLKVAPTRFEEGTLYRHSDFVKKEAGAGVKAEAEESQTILAESYEDLIGDMDEVDFAVSGDGHPDEVALENSIVSATSNGRPQAQTPGAASRMQPPGRPLARATSAGNLRGQPQTPNGQGLRSNGPQAVASHHAPPPRAQQAQNVGGLSSNSSATGGSSGLSTGSSTSSTTASANVPGAAQDGAEPNADGPGFFSARAINQLPVESLSSGAVVPLGGQVFNPRLESPSIRKTPGIDHTTSKPLARNGQHVMPTASQAAAVVAGPGGPSAAGINDANASPQGASHVGLRPAPLGVGGPPNRGNVVNPQLDQARRIGAPGSAGSPLANRGQYRPPTMKRPLPAEAPQRGPAGGGGGPGTRPPLAEVSTNGAGSASSVSSGADVKRQKMS